MNISVSHPEELEDLLDVDKVADLELSGKDTNIGRMGSIGSF
jgi:hypothetical protein